MHTLAEHAHIVTVLAPDADRYASSATSDVVNLALYDEVVFVLSEGAGGTGTAVITVEECTSAAGAGNTAIAFQYKEITTLGTMPASWTSATSSGFTTTAGANKDVLVRVRAAETSDGSPYVRFVATESANDPVDAGAIAILSGARYAQGDMPSPLT